MPGLAVAWRCRPDPVEMAAANGAPCGDAAQHAVMAADDSHAEDPSADAKEPDYVKMNNQFVIPVVEDGAVTAQ